MQQEGKCISWYGEYGEIELSEGTVVDIHFNNIVGLPPTIFRRLYVGENVEIGKISHHLGVLNATQVSVKGLKKYLLAAKVLKDCLYNYQVANQVYNPDELIRTASECRRYYVIFDDSWNVLIEGRRSEKWLVRGIGAYDEFDRLAGHKDLEERYRNGPQQTLNTQVLGYKIQTLGLKRVLSKIAKASRVATQSRGGSSIHDLEFHFKAVIGLDGLEYVRRELQIVLQEMALVCRRRIETKKNKDEVVRCTLLLEAIERELKRFS